EGKNAATNDDAIDRGLDHAITYALIEIGDQAELAKGLKSSHPRVRRASLAALDQLGAHLDVQELLPLLNHPDAALRDTARWIAGRHPQWAGELASFLNGQLHADLKEGERAELVELLARFAKEQFGQSLLAQTVRAADQSPAAARIALQAMVRAGLKEAPAAWGSALAQVAEPTSPVLA